MEGVLQSFKSSVDSSVGIAKDIAHKVVLAGFGIYSKAEEIYGDFEDECIKVFSEFVKAGESVEAKAKETVEAQVKSAGTKVDSIKVALSEKASSLKTTVETTFDGSVSNTLGFIGIPTKADIEALSERVETLTKSVKSLKTTATRSRTATATA